MKSLSLSHWCTAALLLAPLLLAGCSGGDESSTQPTGDQSGSAGGPPQGGMPGGPPGGGFGGPGGGGPASRTKEIMRKLAGPQAGLTALLGEALKANPPAWDTVQPQTKEYATLAAEFAKLDPPRGSKESWANLAGAFAKSAADLDAAAQAKDQAKATTAHSALASSCMACHREHRAMGGPGGGGFGGPPGGFGGGRPGGGPPAGGPPAGGAPEKK